MDDTTQKLRNALKPFADIFNFRTTGKRSLENGDYERAAAAFAETAPGIMPEPPMTAKDAVEFKPTPVWQCWRFVWLAQSLPKGRWKFYRSFCWGGPWDWPTNQVWIAVGKLAVHVWTSPMK